MIHKQIDIDAKLTDIPIENFRIRRLKHYTFWRKLFHDPRYYIGSPRIDILGDPLGLDHEMLDPRIEELAAQIDQFSWI
jgi:hypothetical protein